MGKKKNGSILVLDDDFDISNFLKILLMKRGYNVFSFTNPLLALKHFRINHSTYSLVITDLRMSVCQALNSEIISNS
jgi:two-component system, cell cycle response regulator CpdR